jgi:hypothetical protein
MYFPCSRNCITSLPSLASLAHLDLVFGFCSSPRNSRSSRLKSICFSLLLGVWRAGWLSPSRSTDFFLSIRDCCQMETRTDSRLTSTGFAARVICNWIEGNGKGRAGMPRSYFFKIAMRPIKAPSKPVKIPKIPPRTFSHDSATARRSARSFRTDARNSVIALAVRNRVGGFP